MARFAVYANPDGQGYLLDIQADLLNPLNTRVVAPLLPADIAPKPAATLNPVFELDSGPLVMVTQWMAAVPANILKVPVANLAGHRNEITAALDLLFQGF